MIQRTDHSTERSAKKRGSSNYALAAADCVIDRFRSLRNDAVSRNDPAIENSWRIRVLRGRRFRFNETRHRRVRAKVNLLDPFSHVLDESDDFIQSRIDLDERARLRAAQRESPDSAIDARAFI